MDVIKKCTITGFLITILTLNASCTMLTAMGVLLGGSQKASKQFNVKAKGQGHDQTKVTLGRSLTNQGTAHNVTAGNTTVHHQVDDIIHNHYHSDGLRNWIIFAGMIFFIWMGLAVRNKK